MEKKRIMKIGLLTCFVFIAVLVLTSISTKATITRDDAADTITLTEGTYTPYEIWCTAGIDASKLHYEGSGVWLLNYTLLITANATLELSPDLGITNNTWYCSWLKLSDKNETGENCHINVIGGRLFVNNSMITGWNYTGAVNSTGTAFRPWIYCTPTLLNNSGMWWYNSRAGYLGYSMSTDDHWGITWEEIATREPLGEVDGLTIVGNYVGLHFEGVSNFNITDVDIYNYNVTGLYLCVAEPTNNGCDNITLSAGLGVRNKFHGGTDPLSDGIRAYLSTYCNLYIADCYDNNDNGIYLSICDNFNIANCNLYNNQNGTWFGLVTNSWVVGQCKAYSNSHAGYLLTAASETVNFNIDFAYDNVVDYFVDDDCEDISFNYCHSNNSVNGFEIAGDYNYIGGCHIFGHSYAGVYLVGDASENEIYDTNISLCTPFGSAGVEIADNASDNDFDNCTLYGNDYGVWMIYNTTIDNTFWNCYFEYNLIHGIYLRGVNGDPLFFGSWVIGSLQGGIDIVDGANATFVFPICGLNTNYDYFMESDCRVYIMSPFMLGYNLTINEILDYTYFHHLPGDGEMTLVTSGIIATTEDPDVGIANVTHFWGNLPTYARWEVNTTGGLLSQHIGGLSPSYVYQLWRDAIVVGSVTTVSLTFPYYGVTGVLWFNDTGDGFNHVYELVRGAYVPPVTPPVIPPSGGGGAGVSYIKLSVTVKGDDALVSVKNSAGQTIASHSIKDGEAYIFTIPSGSYTIEAKGTKKTLINTVSTGSLSVATTNLMEFNFAESIPGFEAVIFFISAIFCVFILNRRRHNGKK